MKKCGQRVRGLIEAAGRQPFVLDGDEDPVEHQRAAQRGPHAERVPLPHDAQPLAGGRHTEEPDALVAGHPGDDVVDVRRLRQRGEDLAPGDQIAAVDRLRQGGDALGRAGCVALAERLGVECAAVDDALVQQPPAGVERGAFVGGPRQVVGDLTGEQHRDAVHVEGQRGRGCVTTELVAHPAVVGEARPETTPRRRDAQREEPGLAEVGEVVVREARLAVVAFGSLGEHGAELGGRGDERPAVGRVTQRIISWTK